MKNTHLAAAFAALVLMAGAAILLADSPVGTAGSGDDVLQTESSDDSGETESSEDSGMVDVETNPSGAAVSGGNTAPAGGNTAPGTAVIYFFWGDGCPHCAAQKPFLEQLERDYPGLEVRMYETWKDAGNADYLMEMAKAYGTTARGVPMTFIGDYEPTVGFADYMKDGIESKVAYCIENGCIDPASKLN